MKTKHKISYLPGGNPKASFARAVPKIVKRAMPYMGKYNELYKTNAPPYASVARGLSEIFSAAVAPKHLLFCHGAKEALHHSGFMVNEFCRQLAQLFRKRRLPVPKFKMLVRTPTYRPAYEQLIGWPNFECKPIHFYDPFDSGDTGVLNAMNGKYLFGDYNPKNEFIIGYFDINPCNPTGYIRTLAETRSLYHSLQNINCMNEAYLASLSVSLKRPPMFIIEDQIYRGLEYDGMPAASFLSVSENAADITHVILGVSKYGLVGMRASVSVVPAFDREIMLGSFEHNQSDISPFSVLACAYMFGDNPQDKKERDAELKRQSLEYERHAMIATALINGNARHFLNSAEHAIAVEWLMIFAKKTRQQADHCLETGIKGMEVPSIPRAGFFLMVEYRNTYEFSAEENSYDSDRVHKFIRDLLYKKLKTYIGDIEYLGLDTCESAFRFTVAVPPQELIERLEKLREASALIAQAGPFNTDNMPSLDSVSRPRAPRRQQPPRLKSA